MTNPLKHFSADNQQSIFYALHRTVRRFQLKNRFVVRAFDTDLSLLESRILTDLSMQPELIATKLSEKLQISATAISRAISRMTSLGLLKSKPDSRDDRKRILHITAKGFRHLEQFDIRSEQLLADFSQHISNKDLVTLRRLLDRFADGFEAPQVGYQREENPLRDPIRRLTQAMGLLGSEVFHVQGLTSIEWHILAEINDRPNLIVARSLCELFKVPTNTMSGILSRLNRRGLIARKTSQFDKRRQFLQLTPRGKELLNQIEHSAVMQLNNALTDFSSKELHKLHDLLNAFIGDRSDIIHQGATFARQELITEEGRALARALCIRQAGRLSLEADIPQLLFGDLSLCFGLFHASELVAALEFQFDSNLQEHVLVNLVCIESLDNSKAIDQFIILCLSDFFAYSQAKSVIIRDCWLSKKHSLPGVYNRRLSALVVKRTDLTL